MYETRESLYLWVLCEYCARRLNYCCRWWRGEGIVSWTSVGTVLTLQIYPRGRRGGRGGAWWGGRQRRRDLKSCFCWNINESKKTIIRLPWINFFLVSRKRLMERPTFEKKLFHFSCLRWFLTLDTPDINFPSFASETLVTIYVLFITKWSYFVFSKQYFCSSTFWGSRIKGHFTPTRTTWSEVCTWFGIRIRINYNSCFRHFFLNERYWIRKFQMVCLHEAFWFRSGFYYHFLHPCKWLRWLLITVHILMRTIIQMCFHAAVTGIFPVYVLISIFRTRDVHH